MMFYDTEAIIHKEWHSKFLLNPFTIMDEFVDEEDRYDFYDEQNYDSYMIRACYMIAKSFLTGTREFGTTDNIDILVAEGRLLNALFIYLYFETPISMRNLCTICELINRDNPDEVNGSELDRLFSKLEEKNANHPSLFEYNEYRACGSLRNAVHNSLRRRLSPLIAVSSNESKNIFDDCNGFELLQLAESLIHNGAGKPISPTDAHNKLEETSFATVALIYMIKTVESNLQTTVTLFDMFKRPDFYAPKISDNLRNLAPEDFPDLQNIIAYWFESVETLALSGELDTSELKTICALFEELKDNLFYYNLRSPLSSHIIQNQT
jgi:ribonucleotide reductase beta subunit family protein with ferritin-like domain